MGGLHRKKVEGGRESAVLMHPHHCATKSKIGSGTKDMGLTHPRVSGKQRPADMGKAYPKRLLKSLNDPDCFYYKRSWRTSSMPQRWHRVRNIPRSILCWLAYLPQLSAELLAKQDWTCPTF